MSASVPKRDIKVGILRLHLHSVVKAYIRSLGPLVIMHIALYLTALASVAYSQLINLDAIAQDFAPPELVKAPINVELNVPAASTPDPITPLQSTSAQKRDIVKKRDGDCSPYPAGSGPVPSPDTPSAFLSDPDFAVYLYLRTRRTLKSYNSNKIL